MTSQLSDFDFDESVSDLIERFEAALAKIQKALQTFLLTDAQRKDMLKAEKEIIDILSDIGKNIDKWADETGSSVVEESILATLLLLGLVTLAESYTLTAEQEAIVEYTVESIKTDLKSVTSNLQRQSRTVLRRAYTDSIKQTTKQSQPVRQLLNDADVAIIDKAGRRWKTSHYIDMLTRTKLAEAEREAAAVTGLSAGNGHAYISYNATTTDACKDYHYKLVKLAPDINSPYPYYRDLPHIFHPCCRHRLIPISSFDNLPGEVRQDNSL